MTVTGVQNFFKLIWAEYRLPLLISFIVIALFFEFIKGKKDPQSFIRSILLTLKEELTRIVLLSCIALFFFGMYFDDTSHEIYFHAGLEFVGATITFLIVERGIRKLASGINDPLKLPIPSFTTEIATAREELVLCDIFLESLIIDPGEVNYHAFRQSLKQVMEHCPTFTVKILLTKPNTDFAKRRARDRNEKNYDKFNERMERALKKLLHVRQDIWDSLPESKTQIHIRLLDGNMPFAMYSVDQHAYVSFFPKKKKSTDSQQLEIPNHTELGKSLFEFYLISFDKLWGDAEDVSQYQGH